MCETKNKNKIKTRDKNLKKNVKVKNVFTSMVVTVSCRCSECSSEKVVGLKCVNVGEYKLRC